LSMAAGCGGAFGFAVSQRIAPKRRLVSFPRWSSPAKQPSLPFHLDPKCRLPQTCCSQVCFAALATVGSELLSGLRRIGW